MDPAGACKGFVMSSIHIILIMKICERMSYFGPVSPFQPRGGLVLYANSSRSPGRLQPSLVCQVAMPWSRPGGEGWRASKSSGVAMLRSPPFNTQANHTREKETRGASCYPPHEVPVNRHKKKHGLPLQLSACRWLLWMR